MNLKSLIKLFSDKTCENICVKHLSPNDNSKNQIYLGGSFEALNLLPIQEIIPDNEGTRRQATFKSKLNFSWIDDAGILSPAPHAQLILYPDYPEIRFSGFLLGSRNAPSELMTSRVKDRLLFFGVNNKGGVLGYVCAPDAQLAKEFNSLNDVEVQGVFRILQIQNQTIQKDTKSQLLDELKRIHQLGWINSKKLGLNGEELSCDSPHCGGYTLEAELGITPNGFSEPDYLGWEIKQFNVSKFNLYNSKVITLMTPEPTGGMYVNEGVRSFIEKYGYADKMGRLDRMNFGGVHKNGITHKLTGLKLFLDGFDAETGKITNINGAIVLSDSKDRAAASWSFASLLKHWNRKHNKAAYIPSMIKREFINKYSYGNNIILGNGTDFSLFLKEMALGNIVYDPGIKLENISKKPSIKRRSQFRIKSGHLPKLYTNNEVVDLSKI
jgi:hypothetical protein